MMREFLYVFVGIGEGLIMLPLLLLLTYMLALPFGVLSSFILTVGIIVLLVWANVTMHKRRTSREVR